ncbi:glycosyltransferase family 1 protein [Aetokthonos hydrillicola Thurmond2011]|uniref:Glycosyltransferase family 1 protein n=1 Tax=Aetokthonos hydrillicola Thurmond2011 TaxID=2712845 RepID=A0AAP5IE38_9CYAN|nr:glycosyltransferase family 1 protein [Aetokthonos hydrillicola]MBO3460076.1 glycosyltransferase family 1 protein [Aetokthonos hydrillicola CCALA 1050]MBW4589525.1 glycosyltransferase family 1 protein [Aetokthonos hydrillicola CCALA 1050]MDR9899821.1 glycosyltransferase family 1 protein [Aetokthonos hydrillicola Thurmond2011]
MLQQLNRYIKENRNTPLKNQEHLRILHVVGGMNRGGIETWLMHILRHIDRDRFQMDFVVHTTVACAYDEEILSLGSQIIPCLKPSQPWLYALNFRQILREYGPYHIVHSHVHHFNGYVLHLAQQAGVPIRIAHSHLDSSALEADREWYRHLYLTLMKSLIARYAILGLGCSQVANADLFGVNWKTDPRWQVLYYGINLTPFQEPIDAIKVRSEFNLPVDAFVIGHVGRFDPQKNHQFLLKIFAEVARLVPSAYLLLVGEGVLQPKIKQQAWEIGISDRVIFAGSRSDVPRLMRGAMDLFLFPSLCEGLGLVLIEAQAAGLSCIFSDVVPKEADVVKPLLKRLSLSQPISEWANELLAWQNRKPKNFQTDAFKLVEASPFNIETSVKQLEKLYQAQFAKKKSSDDSEKRLLQNLFR